MNESAAIATAVALGCWALGTATVAWSVFLVKGCRSEGQLPNVKPTRLPRIRRKPPWSRRNSQ